MTSKEKIFYLTLTNKGYIEYTENLLASIEANKSKINLNIFALDEESFLYFNEKTSTIKLTDEKKNITEFKEQTDGEFGYLMLCKFKAIHNSLLNEDLVTYIDGDITIKKDFDDILLNNIEHRDILFQNDKRPSKPNEEKLCAGFMCIKSNNKTKKIFEPTDKLENLFMNYKTHDQTYLNKNKNKFNYGVLPLEKFPNGPYFYSNFGNFDPWMIHFNFLLGHEKKKKMKEYGEWYLNT